MRRLSWTPTALNIKVVPVNPKAIEVYDTDEKGQTRKMKSISQGGETRSVHDRSDCATLKIQEADFKIFVPSIQWILGGQHSFCFAVPKPVEKDENGFLLIPTPGILTPELDPADVHEICTDWQLLGKRFPVYVDIFKTTGDTLLGDLVFMLAKIHQEDLPSWAKRIVELKGERKEPGQNGDSGWEQG